MEVAQIGHSILSSQAQPIDFPISDESKQFIDSMLATLKKQDGVGIAAPQLFRGERIIIVASSPNKRYPNAPSLGPIVMINPRIVEYGDEHESDWEGCLSVPGIRALVPRSIKVEVLYQNIQGDEFTEVYDGFVARIIQHEVDHLDGICFLERVEDKKSFVSEAIFQKRVQEKAHKRVEKNF